MNDEIGPELVTVFEEIRETMPEIIKRLRIEIGRMPTETEVSNFFWAPNDEARAQVIRKARERE